MTLKRRVDTATSERSPRPVCVFLIPVVRDSDRKPHTPLAWRLLQDVLIQTFGGSSGPEEVLYYRSPEAVPGMWTPGGSESPVEDRSRKYTLAIPRDRVEDLRVVLRRAGNSFDQRVIYLEVAGYAEFVNVHADAGFLDV